MKLSIILTILGVASAQLSNDSIVTAGGEEGAATATAIRVLRRGGRWGADKVKVKGKPVGVGKPVDAGGGGSGGEGGVGGDSCKVDECTKYDEEGEMVVFGQYMCMSKNGREKTMCVTSDNAQIAKQKNGMATCGCCGDCPADTCEGDDEVDCTLDEEEDGGGDGSYMCMTLGNGKNMTKCVADEDILQKGLMGATCGCCGESCPAETCDDDDCTVEETGEPGSFMCFIIGNGKPKTKCVGADEVFKKGLKQGGVCGCCEEECPEPAATTLPP